MDYYNIFMGNLDFCKEIYIPILSSTHYCLARVIISLKTVEVWDSLADEKTPVRQCNKIKEILRNLDLAMANQIKKRPSTFSIASFCIRRAQNVPRQPNSFDCGVFVALFMIHSAVANRVAVEACVQARNEGRDLAREGNEIIREACKLSPELSVIDLVRDGTSRKDEEISITEKFSKKRQEINQRLSDIGVKRIKLNQLFESRCIPKLNLKEAIDIQKQQHVTIQKLLHEVEKEELY
ncbi:hypothetical protein F8388_011749 [Cannabis sativa]|uniref:Ubiquitin-like protease family profile domain-containing protein n=1 Tax=Cannabis sativa TaxID=3483 RepID=A0A7J6FJ34_CANSA|nr:hypothetical protein F8388_011749 [Cannabis sativa]